MNIGDKIDYIRHLKTAGVTEGIGYIKAYGLDHENRVIALVQDEVSGETFHVFEKGVNPTDEFKALFTELVDKVRAIEEAGNTKIKTITDKANNEIGKLHDEVIGVPVDIPVVKPSEGATINTPQPVPAGAPVAPQGA